MTDPANTVSFTGIPNILKIKETNNGTYASATITISDLSKVTSGTEYTLIINGQKLTSTTSLVNAVGNKFYLTNTNSSKTLVAYKLVETLRSLPTLPLNYSITIATSASGTLSPVITLMAKAPGQQFNLSIEGTLITSNIATKSITNGTTSSGLLKGTTNKVLVEVYEVENIETNDKIGSTQYNMGNYLTTLTKEAFGEEVLFDLTPLLTSITDYNKLNEVNLYIYVMNDDVLSLAGIMKDIYFTTGYMVNQGLNYIAVTSETLAQNVSRGETQGKLNNTILYIYQPTVTLSLYVPFNNIATLKTLNIKTSYINSANVSLSTTSTLYAVNKSLTTFNISLSQNLLNQSFYIDINIENVGTIRYNVIKPFKATDEIQRVYWTNSYGGTSFFDFTGSRSETRKTKVNYYEKNLFDYYDGDAQLKKVYDKNVDITVSLSSHNIKKDGTWIFFDMQNSSNAWTYVNNKKYFITITDLKITESNVNDIYVASIEYTYSLADTI